MTFKIFCAAAVLALCGATQAQPTDSFYLMHNTFTGKELCAQTPFSPDWAPRKGPYKDQNCTIAKRPAAPQPAHLPANPLDLPKARPSQPQADPSPATARPAPQH